LIKQHTIKIAGLVAFVTAQSISIGPLSAQQASPQDFANCQQNDNLAAAIAGCTRIANDPTQPAADRARAWHLVGNNQIAANALDEAIRAFGEAIKLDQRGAPIYYASRAIAELRKNDRASAIADYRKAVELDARQIGEVARSSPELNEIAQAAASAPQPSPTLAAVRARGKLRCGLIASNPGFSVRDADGRWIGLYADFCKGLAAAIFADPNRVDFITLAPKDRFSALQSPDIDVLVGHTAKLPERERQYGIKFAATNFFSGYGFLVRLTLKVASTSELDQAEVCVLEGSLEQRTLATFMHDHNLRYKEDTFGYYNELMVAFEKGSCDAVFGEIGNLRLEQRRLNEPTNYVVIHDLLPTVELAPAVRQGDEQWLRIVSWTHYATVAAAELGLKQATVEAGLQSSDPAIRRLLGANGPYGGVVGLNDDWAYHVIKAVGNYREIYYRDLVQPLNYDWGSNNLVRDGGKQQAPQY
jgi:general L-amino acid transport system substrate-binding protein